MAIDFTARNLVEEATDLVDDMTDEELNRFVDYIRYTMKDRANRRNAKARATIQVGDRVKFAGKHKPAYLNGMTGEIVEKRQTRLIVLLDHGPVGKFRSGKVLAQASGLEVIS